MRHTGAVSARSNLFDLYGDHLAEHGFWAPISGLVELLGHSDIAPSATRTAVSRLVDQGWLEPAPRAGTRGYRATDMARKRLLEAHGRIYRRNVSPWNGQWELVRIDPPAARSARDRLAAGLGYLGYGRLDPRTWLAPRHHVELEQVVTQAGLSAQRFALTQVDGTDPAALARQVWDVDTLAESYRRFLAENAATLDAGATTGPDDSPEDSTEDNPARDPEAGLTSAAVQAYALRTDLVHQWRKFLFIDPDLPAQALPVHWPGDEARRRFLRAADALAPASRKVVSDALSVSAPAGVSGVTGGTDEHR